MCVGVCEYFLGGGRLADGGGGGGGGVNHVKCIKI